jgi:hypothetical protein
VEAIEGAAPNSTDSDNDATATAAFLLNENILDSPGISAYDN